MALICNWKSSFLFLASLVYSMMALCQRSSGFVPTTMSITPPKLHCGLFMGSKNDNDENDNIEAKSSNTAIDDLSWRVDKVRLEEANTKRFIKRKPIKMSYRESQKWIQRNFGVKTKEEFNDLVANGNLRTPYISKRPEEYYGERGEWISWEHYLLGDCTEPVNEGTQSKWQ